MMNKEGIDEASIKQLERIHKENVRLASFINDILILSKIENGEQSEKVYAEIYLRDLACEVLR